MGLLVVLLFVQAPLNKQDNQDDFCQLALQSQSRIVRPNMRPAALRLDATSSRLNLSNMRSAVAIIVLTCSRCACAQAPITISRKPFQHEKSLRIVLFVSDNPASRKALRMAKVLMQNDANHLRIAHVVASQPGKMPLSACHPAAPYTLTNRDFSRAAACS